MTRVDFYVLPDPELEAARRFACRLAYRAVCNGHRPFVLTGSEAESADLDSLMWVYPEHQFLPHGCPATGCTATHADAVEVLIGHDAPGSDTRDYLINLATVVPAFFGRFERVAEIVTGGTRAEGRKRYKHYRDRGYPLHHHELNDWEASP